MAPKRKRAEAAAPSIVTPVPLPEPIQPKHMSQAPTAENVPKRRASKRNVNSEKAVVNPDINGDIHDGEDAARASPDSDVNMDIAPTAVKPEENSELSDVPDIVEPPKKKRTTAPKKKADTAKATGDVSKESGPKKAITNGVKSEGVESLGDPEAEGEEEVDEEDLKQALARPPPVNSDYLPLPWKGRLGYACLNTYLRFSNPPVFSSRTCRIASILEHRHPLKDPSQPEHPTKNRPDKDQPADMARGQKHVEELGLANARDIIKMLRWNDRYGIKFMRLSSEMFPFASHAEYGYKLAPFASETLAEVGKVVAELGHRVTTHPGQFTQLGSPRTKVVDDAIRDLEYHDEMLSLLKLPPQEDRDAVMILHMGGVFGDKAATLDRFRENYAKLPQSIKNRLVLENDDMSWSVHDLLPICKELNIPMVLDWHHHNIIFDSEKIREGTKDILDILPEILETWKRKNITPKMHYSEPTPQAITGQQRRKHSPRVATLPPCPNDMDLMIEAKDKEQAVFELMRIFKLPGYDTFNDILPHVRGDDNKPVKAPKKKATPKKRGKKAKVEDDENAIESAAEELEAEIKPKEVVPEEEVGMGGPEGRVYWPPGMEEWLRPKKREIKKKDPAEAKMTPAKKKKLAKEAGQDPVVNAEAAGEDVKPKKKTAPKKKTPVKKEEVAVPTPSASDDDELSEMSGVGEDDELASEAPPAKTRAPPSRKSSRAAKVSYAEAEGSEID